VKNRKEETKNARGCAGTNKRIVILINSLSHGGGAERIATELGNNLGREDFDITFLACHDSEHKYDFKEEYEYLYEEKEFGRYSEGTLQNVYITLKTAKKVARFCKDKEVSIVISFLDFSNVSVLLSRILFRNKAKVIVSVRNNPLKSIKSNLQTLTMKRLYPKADKVVALSRGVENTLKENFSLLNTTYIHNMQDIEKFNKLAEEKIEEEHTEAFGDDFTFITVGSFERQKGQWYLLRCFKKVNQINSNSRLIILGQDRGISKELKELTKRLNLENRVFFLGRVNNVFPYLKKADCFVFTSLWEGFGNVLTEALSQNIPVISTDCLAGPREILCPELSLEEEIEYPYYGQYGVLTNPFEDKIFFGDLEEENLSKEEEIFSETMIEVMKDEELRNKYSKGLERAKEFSSDKIMVRWKEVIEKIVLK